MTEQELEPLSPELGALLENERSRPGLSPAQKARVFSRVQSSIASSGGGSNDGGDTTPPAAAPLKSLGAKSLSALGTAFVVGGVVGAAIHAAWVKREPLEVEPATPVVVSEPAPRGPVDPVSSPNDLPLAPVPKPSERASRSSPLAAAPSASVSKDSDLAEERSLLTTARTALSRSKPESALAALRQHSARFPKGRLKEERESLWVQALALAGRTGEAEARAADFQREYPKSLLGPAVEATLDEAKQARDH